MSGDEVEEEEVEMQEGSGTITKPHFLIENELRPCSVSDIFKAESTTFEEV